MFHALIDEKALTNEFCFYESVHYHISIIFGSSSKCALNVDGRRKWLTLSLTHYRLANSSLQSVITRRSMPQSPNDFSGERLSTKKGGAGRQKSFQKARSQILTLFTHWEHSTVIILRTSNRL